LKVLIIDHMGVLPLEHKRYEGISKYTDIDLTLLVPTQWRLNFKKVHLPRKDEISFWQKRDYKIIKGKVVLAGRGGCSFYYTGLLKALCKFKPDIIHLFQEPWSFFTFQTIFLSKILAPKRKIIFLTWENIYRNFKYPSPLSFIYSFIDKYTYRNANYAFPTTEEAKKVLILKGFKKKIKVIPWGIDPHLFKKIEETENIRKKLNLKNFFVIGYVGRLVKEKGILTLIEASSTLKYNYKLLFVGEGPLKDIIIKRALFVGINKNRLVFVDTVNQRELVKYYNCLNILVLPSITTSYWKEQFGRVLIEAMACEVPVIGSNSGEIPGVINKAGLIFKEGDADDLKEKIIRLAEHPDLRRKLGKEGRKHILENYTWKNFAERVYKVYKELVGQKERK